MPWKVPNKMDLKSELIQDWNNGYSSKTDLSQKYGISRPTVYKWLALYEKLGADGLKEQSRAPKACPHRTPESTISLLIQEKLRNLKRGPRKVRAQLKRKLPEVKFPSISTVAYWFKKAGLIEKRKKRLHVPPYTQPFTKCYEPNDVWSIDYKGQFYMLNKRVCYPLTVTDNCSRYILGCDALPGPRYIPTRNCLKEIFREYGLPLAIRFDNGTPFAGRCIGGLSRLMIWFILLGIIPERITKGCPQENGRHERMHRTMKSDALDPVARNIKEQQKAFVIYRNDFNDYRPHEALNDLTPSDCYKKSNRPFIAKPQLPDYGQDYLVRHIRHTGEMKFKGRTFYISDLLAGMPIALKEIADGLWQIQFSFYILGSVDLRKNKIIRD
jgi:transposase InsO family protein